MRAFKPQSRLALFAAIMWCAVAVSAQTPPAPQAQSTPSRHHTRAAHAQAPAEPTPPPPPPPNWPINSTPIPPSVKWNATGLSIEASNASLRQILDDIASATGTRVEGFSQDQRVFGNFGPGRPRDVLSQLLQGSGYNIVMIGDQGTGAPRELLLSGRNAGGPSQAQAPHPTQDDSDDDSYDGQIDTMPPAQPPPEPMRFAPDAGRTPQQIQQELQQRQQQMLIQQQNQPQQTTNPPPN
ncbi:MAG: hypothetical protein WBF42_11680 [Terracidiphilus sp.]